MRRASGRLCPPPLLRVLLVLGLCVAGPSPVAAKAFVITHFIEKSGPIGSGPSTFDSQIFLFYSGGIAGTPAGHVQADLYLFDQATGQPMTSSGAVVCNPCSYTLGAGSRKRKLVIEQLIQSNTGQPMDQPVRLGYGIVVVNGSPDDVANLNSFIENVHSRNSPFELSVFGYSPEEIRAPAPRPQDGSAVAGTTALHVLARYHESIHIGPPGSPGMGMDSEIHIAYVGGQAGLGGGGGATVDLYLLGDDGGVLTSATGADVCNPCQFVMGSEGAAGAAPRKRSIRIDDLIAGAGGFAQPEICGHAVLVTTGDADHVSMLGAVTRDRGGAADSTYMDVPLQRIAGTSTVSIPRDVPGVARSFRASPNPASGDVTLTFTLERAGEATLEVFDAQGRRLAQVARGPFAAGAHTVRWNRRDDSGAVLEPGLYFGRLTAADGSSLARLVVIP